MFEQDYRKYLEIEELLFNRVMDVYKMLCEKFPSKYEGIDLMSVDTIKYGIDFVEVFSFGGAEGSFPTWCLWSTDEEIIKRIRDET